MTSFWRHGKHLHNLANRPLLADERAALDNRGTESLVARELAHQWFGDLVDQALVSCLIKEGMASYPEVMWTESEAADAAYYRLLEARNYITEDSSRYRRPSYPRTREAIELYDRHHMKKVLVLPHPGRVGRRVILARNSHFVQDNAHKL